MHSIPAPERSNSLSSARPPVLALVRPEELWKHWGDFAPLIDAACARSRGRFDPGQINRAVAEGRKQLWAAVGEGVEAVAVTEIVQYDAMKALAIVILTGHDRERWMFHVKQLENFAKAQGCQLIEAWARPGWEHMTDWKKSHILLEKWLDG